MIFDDPKTLDPSPNPYVSFPSHYTQSSKIECIEAMAEALSPAEFEGFLRGNAFKYIWRCKHKGDAKQDIEKAIWYLQRLTQCYDG